MKFINLSESFLSIFSAKDRMGDKITGEIYKNPTQKELKYVENSFSTNDDLPAFLHLETGDLYIFTPYLLHHYVKETGKIPDNSIGVRIYHDNNDCEITVTDSSKNTTWHHNKNIAQAILSSYLSKLFQIVDISYYDNDIVGDWSDFTDHDD